MLDLVEEPLDQRATLSAFLNEAGIDVPMTLGAGNLAARLRNNRHWNRIDVGKQQRGDVGVCYDKTSPAGADHVYLVVERKGKTPTEYFLRAPDEEVRALLFERLSAADDEELPDEDTNDLPEPFMDDGTPRLMD